jgi:hypothetical protein
VRTRAEKKRHQALSFNGEPQAYAKSCIVACGLPLNDQFNTVLVPFDLLIRPLNRIRLTIVFYG